MPSRLWVETTSRCNLSCGSCLNRMLPPGQKKDMEIKLYTDIIDQAAGKVHDINLFHRGEPLLHPHIIDMIAYAAGRGIKTRVHTNAVLLDEKLGRGMISAGLGLISFSFDGYSKQYYENRRRGADFHMTLGNIKSFLELRKALGSDMPVTVIQVMEDTEDLKSSERIKQKKDFLKNFKHAPPDMVVTRIPHNWGGLLDGPRTDGGKGIKRHPCTFPWYSLTIFSDGRAYPCPQDFMGAIPVGDTRKESLADIFNGQRLRAVRRMFASLDIDGKLPCIKCDRIIRKAVMGIPLEYAGAFFRDNMRGLN